MDDEVRRKALVYAKNEQKIAMLDQSIPEKIAAIIATKAQIQEANEAMRQEILTAMEQYNVTEFENDYVKFKYVKPSQREGVDLTKLKAVHPDIAEKFKKITNVKSSVRITVK